LVIVVSIIVFYFGFALSGNVVSSVSSPQSYFSDEELLLHEGGLLLEHDDVRLVHFSDTGSMEPLISGESRGIVVSLESYGNLAVGDIIGFEKNKQTIVHRVIGLGEDAEGFYVITRGDNGFSDDGKVRKEDIEYVVVGILY